MGSGCGAVGRAVAYDTRGPGFESSHWQLLLNIYLLLTVCRKDENKRKEAGNGPSLKKTPSNEFVVHNTLTLSISFITQKLSQTQWKELRNYANKKQKNKQLTIAIEIVLTIAVEITLTITAEIVPTMTIKIALTIK